jgi:SMI1 / KNR4 family (SUKH-1)
MANESTATREPNDLTKRLIKHWAGMGVKTRPGATAAQIKRFESRYQVVLPPDLYEYFAAVDGMEEGEYWDDFTFLPLRAVKSIPEIIGQDSGGYEIMPILPDPERWFVVVDYMLWAALYAIRLSPVVEDSPVLWRGDYEHRIVAASFSAFLEAYMTNPDNLL